jgi:hypothetical protein
MKLIWHMIGKDARRLRLPLALWGLLMVAEAVFYATIAGPGHAPNLEWANRMMVPPELLLRGLLAPLIAYLLTGWLAYDDPLVEQDPFWITRPISGGQLLAAKVLGALLMFVAVPVAVCVPWWLHCGLGAEEIAAAAGRVAGLYTALVAIGLTCASLSDGFPRYILWTIVGLGALLMVYGLVALLIGKLLGFEAATGWSDPRQPQVLWADILVTAGAVLVHQFATRRLRRSIFLLLVCAVAMAVGGTVWSQFGLRSYQPSGDPANAAIRLTMDGPARYSSGGPWRRGMAAPYLKLGLAMTGVPKNSAVTLARASGEWSFQGVSAWKAEWLWGMQVTPAAVREILGLPAGGPKAGAEAVPALTVPLKISQVVAEKMLATSSAFHGTVSVTVHRGTVLFDVPLREAAAGGGGRAYTVSELEVTTLKPAIFKARQKWGLPTDGRSVSLVLTERFVSGAAAVPMTPREVRPFPCYALVKRRTGEVLLVDGVISGPVGYANLDQVEVRCMKLGFTGAAMDGWIEEGELVVIRFEGGEVVSRELDVEAFPVVREKIAVSAAPATP